MYNRPLRRGRDEKMGWPCGSGRGYSSNVYLDGTTFGQQWVRAWNAHDVDAVLRSFHDDVVFTSPVAAELLPETQGVIRGEAALRRYWTTAVQRIPDLRFAVEGLYQGIDTLVIAYRNQNNARVSEVLKFDTDALVIEGHGTYSIAAQR